MIRKARIHDIDAIQKLINAFAQERLMLPRARSDLFDHLRDFFVAEKDGEIIGCAALHVIWDNLAEVRSLAVAKEYQGRGVGGELVKACEREALELEITRVFTLTFAPSFFERLGYREIEKEKLPHKVWMDCVKCPFFPNCNEVAMIKDLA